MTDSETLLQRVRSVAEFAFVALLLLAACGRGPALRSSASLASSTVQSAQPASGARTPPAPGDTATPVIEGGTNSSAAPTSDTNIAARTPSVDAAQYRDDRSNALTLIASYYNAINRQEYARAYGYWEPAAAKAQMPSFAQFQQGYANTASVQLTVGLVAADAGAGQLYYTLPVELVARTKDGKTQAFTGCYALHIARPELQAVPPYDPLRIQSATVRSTSETTARAQLGHACEGASTHQAPPIAAAAGSTTNDDAASYLDDRSTPEMLLRSYSNAINRKEYTRAYSYWESEAAASELQPFPEFKAGYAQTASMQINTAPPVQGGHGGLLSYAVPVAIQASTTDSGKQVFTGCYHFRFLRPELQAMPPFQPLVIESASLHKATEGDGPPTGVVCGAP